MSKILFHEGEDDARACKDGTGAKYSLPHMHTNVMQGIKPLEGYKAWHELAVGCTKHIVTVEFRTPLEHPWPQRDTVPGHRMVCFKCRQDFFAFRDLNSFRREGCGVRSLWSQASPNITRS